MRGSNMQNIMILMFVGVQYTLGYITEKPDFVKTCYKNAPEFANCSRESVQEIFNVMKNGYNALDLPVLDPLELTEVHALQAGEGPVSLNASLNSITIRGLGRAIVISNKVDPKTYSFTIKLKVPHLRVECGYSLNGRALLLPITGSGHAWFEPSDMEVTSFQNVRVEKRDGHSFFNVTGVKVDFKVKGLKLQMDNLFNGQKELENSTNIYLNNNWQLVLESIKPILSNKIGAVLNVLLGRLFENVPAEYFIGDMD